MSLNNLQDRIEKLEQAKGIGTPTKVMCVKFVSPEGPEQFTLEKTAALEAYKKKLESEPLAEGEVVKVLFWTREKVKELMALAGDTSPQPPT